MRWVSAPSVSSPDRSRGTRRRSPRRAPFPRILPDNGYATAGFRQMASDSDARPHAGRRTPARSAHRVGVRPFLGIPGHRVRPIRPIDRPGQHHHRRSRGHRRRTVLPAGCHDGQDHPVAAPGPRAGRDETLVRLLLDRLRQAPHHVQAEWSARYRGKFDQGWDTLREETFARGRRNSAASPPTRCSPRGRTSSPPGTRCRATRRRCTPGRWRSTPGTRRTPTTTSAGCWTPSRRWARSTTPW